jgi:hypothetical protein
MNEEQLFGVGGWKLRGVSEDITRGGRRRAREQEMYFMAK